MNLLRHLGCAVGIAFLALSVTAGAQTLTLHGAVQFSDDHAFNKTLLKFEELVNKYYGKPVKFVLHRNSELGTEKDYFAYLSQGLSVDYAIVSPSHMSTFSKTAPMMDMPFLLRDLDHWNKVLDSDALKPIEKEVARRADVLLIGYAGGGIRQLIVNRPVRNMAELKGLKIRVQGAPIQTRMFQAISTTPTVIAYNEIYNAIQTGVIQAAENEAAGIDQMKFYEVGPHIALTRHSITIRPLAFSGKTFRRLPKDLQAAVLRAGREAGVYGRKIESSEDQSRLQRMEKEGKLKTYEFVDRAKLLELAEPVKDAHAKEIGAEKILQRINAIK